MNNKIRIKIICRHPKDFLEELLKIRINIYDLKLEDKYLELIILKDDLKKIDKIKYIHKIKIINYYGIEKVKFLLKKYRLLTIYVVIGILLNILLSRLIFNIEIDTPNKKIEQIIINDLKDNKISKYRIKKSYKNIQKVKEKILKKEHNIIEWIEIEEHGTKYVVKIEERKLKKEDKTCSPRNIVAKKNAVITKINSSSGEIVKKINDYVEKNEIIVSGLIYKDEDVVSTRCSEGKVYGEVWYKVHLEIPKRIKKEEKTNNKSYGISLQVLNNEYDLNHKYKNYEKKQYNIVNSRIYPFRFSLSKYTELKVTEDNYNISNIDKYALNIALNKIKKEKNTKVILNKKVLKKTIKNSKIIVEVVLSVEEDITEYKDVELNDTKEE